MIRDFDADQRNGFGFQVVVDHGETPNKCTILPLRGRSDFTITKIRSAQPGMLNAPLLLHPDGECLSEIDPAIRAQASGIAAIDSIWRRLPVILKAVAPHGRLVRIPAGYVTAYPRRAKIRAENRLLTEGRDKLNDPEGGLATIEALFLGALWCGHYDPTLLANYHCGAEFILKNSDMLRRLPFDVDQMAIDVAHLVAGRRLELKLQKHSQNRRFARGRPLEAANLTRHFMTN